MHRIVNTTPFRAALDIFPDRRGVDTLHVTLKATFRLGPALAVSDDQAPIRVADEYTGEPASSSLRYPGERHLAKPGTDILLVGEAHAPRGEPVTTLDVALAVGPVRKVIRVVGDRQWQRGPTPSSAPVPFVTMPLVHERAFGGPLVPHNRVGRGHRGGHPHLIGAALPNLEDPRRPFLDHGDASLPACFAAIAPSWSPRCELAGTYDESWARQRAPYLPADFDPRFFHAAPPDQTTATHLHGGEPVELLHLAPEPLRFTLPVVTWTVRAHLGGDELPLAPELETVMIEPDADRLCLLWRAAAVVDRRALELDEVTVDLHHLHI
jgi:hypothetical protein